MIYAMSDIHGCLTALEENLALIDLSGTNRLVLLGDYIGYGHESCAVLERIRELQREYGAEKVIVLKGNHEAMFLEWIAEYERPLSAEEAELAYDSWLKTDGEYRYNTYRTFLPVEVFEKYLKFAESADFAAGNTEAVRLLMKEKGDLIKWLRGLPLFYETEDQIFVHAGVDEEAGEYWSYGTGEEVLLWKFPATCGKFLKTIVAGHVGTSGLAHDRAFHDVFYDGESHYFIDGSVYNHGKLLILGYDEASGKYYQIEKSGRREVRAEREE